MVINDFDIFRANFRPPEAQSKLLVNPEAVLASAITTQSFQSIAGRYFKVLQLICELKLAELPQWFILCPSLLATPFEARYRGNPRAHLNPQPRSAA